ncbi:MAG: hypothetical protein RIS94_741 [Pseudomonadota bacterium]
MSTTPAFSRIGIVGTGRVARALALALAPQSAAPPAFWGRTPARAEDAARAVGGEALSPAALSRACDVIAIAVSDDAIEAVVPLLDGSPAPFIFHVSGRSGANLLAPLRRAGALTAAIHPAMTFTGDPAVEARRMASACFAVTAPDPASQARAETVVQHLGGTAVPVPEDLRPLYHAGLCHASNHLVTLLSGAFKMLAAAGVSDPAALVAPLARAALDNTLERGFAALSGPLLRGDAGTIETHATAIHAHCPQAWPAYRAMALATLAQLESDRAPASPAMRAALGSEGDAA